MTDREFSPVITVSPRPSTDPTNLCVAVYAYGEYLAYIPAYVFSVLSAYENYSCKVYLDDLSPEWLNDSMKSLAAQFGERSQVVLLGKESLRILEILSSHGCRPGFRWFLPYDTIQEFDFVYVGDVDFLIVPEQPALGQQHLEHMKFEGVEYSNLDRGNMRLSGLHFCRADFFNHAYDAEFVSYIQDSLKDFHGLSGIDEYLLYKIVERRYGGIHQKGQFRPGHGFHFAACRRSFFELWINDFHHNRHLGDGWFGQNRYPRRHLLRYFKKNLFNDPLFNQLYERSINDNQRKLRMLLFLRVSIFISDAALLTITAPTRLVRRFRLMAKARWF